MPVGAEVTVGVVPLVVASGAVVGADVGGALVGVVEQPTSTALARPQTNRVRITAADYGALWREVPPRKWARTLLWGHGNRGPTTNVVKRRH